MCVIDGCDIIATTKDHEHQRRRANKETSVNVWMTTSRGNLPPKLSNIAVAPERLLTYV